MVSSSVMWLNPPNFLNVSTLYPALLKGNSFPILYRINCLKFSYPVVSIFNYIMILIMFTIMFNYQLRSYINVWFTLREVSLRD